MMQNTVVVTLIFFNTPHKDMAAATPKPNCPLSNDFTNRPQNDVHIDSQSDGNSRMNTNFHTERIAIYLRVSTSDQNIANQKMMMEAIVKAYGYNMKQVTWYSDDGLSATKKQDLPKRKPPKNDPNHNSGSKLYEAIVANKFDVIFAKKVDRMFRDNEAGAKFVKMMRANHPDMKVITQDFGCDLNTADGEFLFTLAVALARREAAVLSEREKDNFKVMRDDLKPCGQIPYGWKVCHRPDGTKTMRPHWPQQSVIKWIDDNMNDPKGLSSPKMATKLNKWGVPSRDMDSWVACNVWRFSRRPSKYQKQLHQFTPPKTFPTPPPFRCLQQK